LINLPSLVEDAQCVALVREHRWPQGVRCPACGGGVIRNGHDDTQPCRCQACAGRSDALLRPHRGISQDKPPPCLGCFQVAYNARRRGKALPGALIAGLVARRISSQPQNPTRAAPK